MQEAIHNSMPAQRKESVDQGTAKDLVLSWDTILISLSVFALFTIRSLPGGIKRVGNRNDYPYGTYAFWMETVIDVIGVGFLIYSVFVLFPKYKRGALRFDTRAKKLTTGTIVLASGLVVAGFVALVSVEIAWDICYLFCWIMFFQLATRNSKSRDSVTADGTGQI